MFHRVKHLFVWLSRIMHCRGFGIQSPTDYSLVRYVINEHWPYYHYSEVGNDDNWLKRKLGRLYLRLANWRQPSVVDSADYRDYISAGCKRTVFGTSTEMIVLPIEQADDNRLSTIYNKVDDKSLLVLEGLWRNKARWKEIIADSRARIIFDLYYCGIVLFDSKRTKQYYIINF